MLGLFNAMLLNSGLPAGDLFANLLVVTFCPAWQKLLILAISQGCHYGLLGIW